MLCSAVPVAAQKDAAERVQEGAVDQWIEYYRTQRPANPPAAAAEERGKIKEERKEDGGVTERTGKQDR